MAYSIDLQGDIIISGFEKGIAPSPYSGIVDMRSVDPVSIPGEVSVALSTSSIFKAPILTNQTGTLVTTLAGLLQVPISYALEWNQFITFSNLGGATGSGLAPNTLYRIAYSSTDYTNNLFLMYTVAGALVGVSGGGTATFSTLNPGIPQYMAYGSVTGSHFMLDNSGYLWSDVVTTFAAGSTAATHSWTWLMNTPDGVGNGLAVLATPNTTYSNGDEWVFVFGNQSIDYAPTYSGGVPVTTLTWVNGWNPNTGGSGVPYQMQNSIYHQVIVAPDGSMYFLNSTVNAKLTGSIGKLKINFGNSSYTAFTPSSAPSVSNYSYTDYPIIPKFDNPISIAPSSTTILIGGQQNYVYNWDGVSTLVSNYIYVAEKNITAMVTANQNTYIFAGNRGNIYLTNGSQANVWVKFPDHLSNSIYPYWSFTSATFEKGRLYFGIIGTPQGGGNTATAGVWAIDINTQALFCAFQLSYGTYVGYSTCFLQGTNDTPPDAGLYIGWTNGVISGVDVASTTPYSGGQSFIVSDLIPVGTALKPMTAYQAEFKLSYPLALNETVQLLMASSLYDYQQGNFTSIGTTTGTAPAYTTSDGTNPQILSANFPITVQKQQWLILKAILTSTASSPSYNRLVELRVIGDTIKTQVPTQPFAL